MLAHRNAIFGEDAMAKQERTHDLKRKRAAVAAAFALLLAAGTGLGGCALGGANTQLGSASSAEMAGSAAGAGSGYFDEPLPFPSGEGDPFNTEEYASLDEPGFVATAARPLSTLSADADTASYANLRRIVRNGAAPADIPAGAIRTEELLNYFDYGYAPPAGDDLFGLSAQMADCPWNPDTKLLVMGFATRDLLPAETERGANLVFLIDTSGSMGEPDKLLLLQDAFAKLTDQLAARDTVSIVTYASGERVVLEGASGADKGRILRAIRSLHAEGSTNGEAGLEMAYRVARDHFIEGGTNRIVMASDGDLNVGMTSESDLHDYVDAQRATGVRLSVLGFGGGNYKDNKMEVLADHGNGSYHYIDCIAEAERVFGRNLCANLEPLADDVKVQVEFNPAEVKGYRLIGYENRALADEEFRGDAADAGEIGPGHAFTVAFEVVPADSSFPIDAPDLRYGEGGGASGGGQAAASAGEWLTCTLRYRSAATGATAEQTLAVGASALAAEPDADWRFAAAVIEGSMVLRHSPHAGTSTFASAQALAEGAAGTDPARAEFARLLETVASRDDRAARPGSARYGHASPR